MPRRIPLDDPRLVAARSAAARQGGILSRRQLYDLGIARWEVRSHVQARRWQILGVHAVALHNTEPTQTGHLWAAVIQGGPRAFLDGPAALVACGLERFELDSVRVSVPRGARVRRTPGYDIRQTRRWAPDDVMPGGLPRVRPDVAACRAALWAATDRQAVYLLTLVVQQGLTTPERLGEEALRIRRDKRRRLLQATINDLLDGSRSLGEIDVSAELRRRGLPEPDRQVLRRDGARRYYLDLWWEQYALVVEVDGIHHAWAENVVGDALRQNALVLQGATVLRLPLLGLRLRPDDFFAQIERALSEAGFRRAA